MEKHEYKYAISGKYSGNYYESHEDADKHYGSGKSDTESCKREVDVFFTVRTDDIDAELELMPKTRAKIDKLADQLVDGARGVVHKYVLPTMKGEAEVKVQDKVSRECPVCDRVHKDYPMEPEPAKEEPPKEAERWELEPVKVMWELLKERQLSKRQYAIYKEMEEKAKASKPDEIPEADLKVFLRAFYRERDKGRRS